MDSSAAANLITSTFAHRFDRECFADFTRNLLKTFEERQLPGGRARAGNYIYEPYRELVASLDRIGKYTDSDGRTLEVLIVKLKPGQPIDRARTKQRNFIAYYLEHGRDDGSMRDAALVAFVEDGGRSWRFSLVRMEYELKQTDSGKVKSEKTLSPARRFSYLVGEGENTHTARTRFLPILEDDSTQPTLEDLSKSFSVEAITDEFYEQYRKMYLKLHDSLEGMVRKDGVIRQEFEERGIEIEDFAKKLLGQIVFLYFLQRKGWLGVGEGESWGTGPRNFLRRLFDKEYCSYDNFFNDTLEYLFYDMLAVDKGSRAWHEKFNCRIPFLNGGLFEPLFDYDWRKTSILIPNELFSNRRSDADFDSGTGILDVFDRFNFTVKEDEPLEKEVAVDPELLGKVFENLLDVKDRKSKGSYYTPREIVHYMCQESLLSYLESYLKDKVTRTELVELIRFGDVKAVNDANVFAKEGRSRRYRLQLPETVVEHAKEIDLLLSTIKVCDPAVGSGAFALGMLNEIVRARHSLNPSLFGQLDGIPGRSFYDLKWHAVEESVFGVDIDPGAVEIAKLRLWLSLVVDEESLETINPLPNLDYKIMQGNSLLETFEGTKLFDDAAIAKSTKNKEGEQVALGDWGEPSNEQLDLALSGSNHLVTQFRGIQHDYFKAAHKSEKERLKSKLESVEDQLIETTLSEQKKGDAKGLLEKYRRTHFKPYFLWRLNFGEVFQDKRGFDIVIGNPPYDVLSVKETKDPFVAKLLKYAKEDPVLVHSIRGKGNLYKLFCCKALSLVRYGGHLCLIVPMSLLGDDQAREVRKYLLNNGQLRKIEAFPQKDDPNNRVFRSAKLSTCIFLQHKTKLSKHNTFSIRIHPGKEILAASAELKTSFGEVHRLNPESLLIPVCTEGDWKIIQKILNSPAFIPLEEVAKQSQGEVNETSDKTCLKTSNGEVILRGANITLYAVRDASQGKIYFLDKAKYLKKKSSSKKAEHHKYKRVGFQRSAPQNNFRRLIASFIEPGFFCFDTVSYVSEKTSTVPLARLLIILNSKVTDFFFRCFSTNSKVNEYQFRMLPFFKGSETEETSTLSFEQLMLSKDRIHNELIESDVVTKEACLWLEQAALRLSELEKARQVTSKRDRAYLSPQAEQLQEEANRLLFRIFDLDELDAKYIDRRLQEML